MFGEVPSRTWEHVSDAELLAELHRLAGDDNEPPTATDLRERGSHSVQTYVSRFGSWRDALSEAGFEPPPSQGVTTEELLADLRRLPDELEKTNHDSSHRTRPALGFNILLSVRVVG